MISKTDPNVPLFGYDADVSSAVMRRLNASFAPFFAQHILPVLLRKEAEFEILYPAETGRPAWSPARKFGLLILKEVFGHTDEELINALCFDLRFQVALGFAKGEDPYLSVRSLIEYRTRLAKYDPEMTLARAVFDEITDEAIEQLGLSISEQRIDSTLVCSNIRDLARVDLLKTTLIVFLRELYQHDPSELHVLPADLQSWFQADEPSWFGKETEKLTLEHLGRWLHAAVESFEPHEIFSAWESYRHVQRVFHEHFSVEDPDPPPPGPGGERDDAAVEGEVTIHTRKSSTVVTGEESHTLQSPFDPGAGHGHKGTGYSLHLSETCRNPGTEIITGFHLTSANENDFDKAKVLLDDLRDCGRLPTVAYTDAGYVCATSLEAAERRGVQLYGPVLSRVPRDAIGRDAFEFDDDGQVLRCAAGQQPIDHRVLQYDGRYLPHAVFDEAKCAECPLADRCMSRSYTAKLRILPLEHKLTLRDLRLAEQRESAWWLQYSIRSGIEATNSELKRGYGLRKLRVREHSRVLLAATMKLIGCNAARWHRADKASRTRTEAYQRLTSAPRRLRPARWSSTRGPWTDRWRHHEPGRARRIQPAVPQKRG